MKVVAVSNWVIWMSNSSEPRNVADFKADVVNLFREIHILLMNVFAGVELGRHYRFLGLYIIMAPIHA